METSLEKIEYQWVMVLFDGKEFILTLEEYDGFKKAAMAEVKMLHFNNLSVALSQIKYVEKQIIKQPTPPVDWEGMNDNQN